MHGIEGEGCCSPCRNLRARELCKKEELVTENRRSMICWRKRLSKRANPQKNPVWVKMRPAEEEIRFRTPAGGTDRG